MKAYAYAMDCFQKTVYGILEAESMDDAIAHLGDADIIEVDLPENIVRDANDEHRAKLAKKALEERLRSRRNHREGFVFLPQCLKGS